MTQRYVEGLANLSLLLVLGACGATAWLLGGGLDAFCYLAIGVGFGMASVLAQIHIAMKRGARAAQEPASGR